MAPKVKAVKMSLAEFVQAPADGNGGSWADDMDDFTPRGPAPTSYRSSNLGPSDSTVSGFGSLGDNRARGSGPSASMSAPREYQEYREPREYREYQPREIVPLPTQPPYTAHIANLSFQASDEDIHNVFRDLGCPIKSIRVGHDTASGGRKGFGYIDFEELEGLRVAVENNGVSLVGRALRISVAEREARAPRNSEAPSFSRAMFGSLVTRESPAPPAPVISDNASQWRKAGSPVVSHTPAAVEQESGDAAAQEKQSAIPVGVSTWRAVKSAQVSASHSPVQASEDFPVSPVVAAAPSGPPKSRQEVLAKLLDSDVPASNAPKGASPFGEARPVDTVTRQRELEDRIVKKQQEDRAVQKAERDKVAAEKKVVDDRRALEATAKLEEAAQRRRAAHTSAAKSPATGAAAPVTASTTESTAPVAAADAVASAPVPAPVPVVSPWTRVPAPAPVVTAAPVANEKTDTLAKATTEQVKEADTTDTVVSKAKDTTDARPHKGKDGKEARPAKGTPREEQPTPKHAVANTWRSTGSPATAAATPAAAPAASSNTNNNSNDDAGWSTVVPRTRAANRRGGAGNSGRGLQSGGSSRRGDGARQNNNSHRGPQRNNQAGANNAAPTASSNTPAVAAGDAPSN